MSQLYVLDTDICIYWMKGDLAVDGRARSVGLSSLAVTAVTECELVYGAQKSSRPAENLKVLHQFLEKITSLQTVPGVASFFGKEKARLESKGIRLDDADLLIAGIVTAHDAVLVTNNNSHFSRITGLRTENWKESSF